jgi:hypothetical protein
MKKFTPVWRSLLIVAVFFTEGIAIGAESEIEATLNGLHLTIDAKTGSIVGMSYPGVGKMLEASAEQASIIDLAYPIKELESLRLASRYSEGTKIQRTADSVTITWDRLGMSRKVDVSVQTTAGVKLSYDGKSGTYSWVPVPSSAYDMCGKVSATVAIKAAPDGKSVIMTCSLDNQSKNSVRQILFPDFYGLLPLAGTENTIFRSGGVTAKPFIQLKTPPRGCGFWPQDRGMNGIEYTPGAYFGTSLMITQWLDFGSLNGGFSLYRRGWGWEPGDSPWTTRGTVWLRQPETEQKLRMMWATKKEIRPGEKWTSAEFWLTPHAGGWAQGIGPYRDWARSNIKRKYPVPERVRKGLGFRTLWMSNPAYPGDPDAGKFVIWKFKDLPAQAREAKEHGLDEMALWMWNQGLQLPITPPFPRLGSEEDLVKAIAECKKIGVNVSLFISVYSLAEPSASRYGLKVPAEGGWTYDPELIPAFNPYYAHGLGTGGANIGDKNWRADVLASCKHIIDKFTPSLSWDQFAGFPGEPNLYSLTDQIRAMAKAKDPESTFSGESFSNIEMESLYLDYLWSWGSYGMFGDLHAYSTVFPAPRVNPNINTSEVDAKCCFVDNLYMNVMPRRLGSTNGSAAIGQYPELSKALKTCAKLRRQFLPYFVDGTLIGNCILSEECPEAHVNSFVLPDRVLVIILNEGAAGPKSLKYDLAPWLKSANGAYDLKVYNEGGNVVSASTVHKPAGELATGELRNNEITLLEFRSEGSKE